MRPLGECLLDTDLTHLRIIARLWGLELKAGRQREAALELAEKMVAPEVVAEVWEALPPEQKAALQALVEAGGWMPTPVFTRRFGQVRMVGPGRLERERLWEAPLGPAEALWFRGLLFKGFRQGAEGPQEVLFIPPELLALLPRPPTPPAPTLEIRPIPDPPHRRPADDALLDDLVALLAFLVSERVRPRADGGWPETAWEALRPHLREPDGERFAFLLALLEGLGWTRRVEGRLALRSRPVVAWLQAPPEAQRQTLVEAWRGLTGWNELWRLPALRPEETGTWHNDPRQAREALFRHLAVLEPGAWYAIADFIAAVRAVDPDFQRPGGDYETWYIRDALTGEYLSGFESWERVEGALLRALIGGPLHWLGLADLGALDAEAPPYAFRLTAAGAVAVGRGQPEGEAAGRAPPPLVVRPDGTVRVAAARRHDRFRLARVADLVRKGPTYTYRLTAASLERARRQAITIPQIIAFLEEASGQPLPKPLAQALDRWATRGVEVEGEPVVLLRVRTPGLLRRIAESPRVGRYLLRVLNPQEALVRQADWPRLEAALAEMGLLAGVQSPAGGGGE
ncbi:MAG TPA: hypothetical protein ENK56_00730 [Chloroflexi bacterium]|nr:hypothetical protein [Chloroflexota bacterium]